MKRSPWGQVDFEYKIAPGVSWVITPGHGGLLVTKSVARKSLSPTAYLLGESWGPYVAYEEDCGYAVAFSERPEWEARLEQVEFEQHYGRRFDVDSPKRMHAAAVYAKKAAEPLATRRWRRFLVARTWTDYEARVLAGQDRYPEPPAKPLVGELYAVVAPWSKAWHGRIVKVTKLLRTNALGWCGLQQVRVPFKMLRPLTRAEREREAALGKA